MTGRAAIVAALATVTGLSPSPNRPVTVTYGTAWPVWVRTEYQPGLCPAPSRTEWRIVVPLPPERDGDDIDTARDLVAAALWHVGTVTEAVPDDIEVSSDGVQAPAVVYTLLTDQ